MKSEAKLADQAHTRALDGSQLDTEGICTPSVVEVVAFLRYCGQGFER